MKLSRAPTQQPRQRHEIELRGVPRLLEQGFQGRRSVAVAAAQSGLVKTLRVVDGQLPSVTLIRHEGLTDPKCGHGLADFDIDMAFESGYVRSALHVRERLQNLDLEADAGLDASHQLADQLLSEHEGGVALLGAKRLDGLRRRLDLASAASAVKRERASTHALLAERQPVHQARDLR